MSVKRSNSVLPGFVTVTVLGAVLGAAGAAQAAEPARRYVVVQWDLEAAMKNESLDAARYARFAQQARERGNAQQADVFERVATAERGEHLQRLAALSGQEAAPDPAEQEAALARLPNQSDAANLRDAITNERSQANTLRSEMVNRALKYGDVEAAQTFLTVGRGEIDNLLALRAARKLARQTAGS